MVGAVDAVESATGRSDMLTAHEQLILRDPKVRRTYLAALMLEAQKRLTDGRPLTAVSRSLLSQGVREAKKRKSPDAR